MSESIPDYYAVLGVTRSASERELRRAYRRLARRLHPDLNPRGETTLAGDPDIRLVNEAWDVLGDPDTRTAYDRATRTAERPEPDHVLDVQVPLVPDGFELHPARGWAAAGYWLHHRAADGAKGALSLAAQSADMSNLSRLGDDELWFLDTRGFSVTDSDIRSLTRFHRIEELWLDESAVTDAGLQSLPRFPRLRTVSLTKCPITDDGIRSLASIPGLKNLEIDQTAVTDEGLVAFQGHPTLVTLDIRRTKVRGRGIRHLTDMPELRELRVSGWAELAAMRAFLGRREVRIL